MAIDGNGNGDDVSLVGFLVLLRLTFRVRFTESVYHYRLESLITPDVPDAQNHT